MRLLIEELRRFGWFVDSFGILKISGAVVVDGTLVVVRRLKTI